MKQDTTREWLTSPFENWVPHGLDSMPGSPNWEATVAVIQARSAIASAEAAQTGEKVARETRRLVWATGAMALATFALVLVEVL